MAKYIIEFEDEPTAYEDGMTFYACKQIPYWHMSKGQLNRLTPYTEPDLSPLVDEAVETIENEVWEFAKKMVSTSESEISDVWGCATNFGEVMHNTTYQEAKAKYESWEAEREQIRMGDEVEAESGNKACVLYENPGGTQMFVFKADGTAAWWSKCAIHKTGKNHPEVAELLKKMRDKE